MVHEGLEHDDLKYVVNDVIAYHMFLVGKGYMDALEDIKGKEVKLAINAQGQPVDFFDESALFRGVIDVLGENYILDWKTGYKTPSPLQLGAYQLLAEAHGHYPHELKYCMLRQDYFETVYATPELFNEARDFIITTIQQIESDTEHIRNVAAHCDYCPYINECKLSLANTPEAKALELLLCQAKVKQLREGLKEYIQETGNEIITNSGIYAYTEKVSRRCTKKHDLMSCLKDKNLLEEYSEVKSSEYDRLLEEHPEFEIYFKNSIRNTYGFKEFKIAPQ